jgi:hypothetical protein
MTHGDELDQKRQIKGQTERCSRRHAGKHGRSKGPKP